MTRFDMPTRTLTLPIWILTLALAAGLAVAQDDPAQDPPDRIAEAEQALQAAIDSGQDPYPDRPAWRDAIDAAEAAVEANPNDRRALRLHAEALSRSQWLGPAWEAWMALVDAGHAVPSDVTSLFVEVGNELAYLAYEQGNLQRATEVYRGVLDEVPFSKEANVWMGRIRMEQERPSDAVAYWRAVVDQDPDDDRAAYFLELAREQARWGVAAVTAFREGVDRYENGELASAGVSFERATDANQDYPAAWAWRGRVAFEQAEYVSAGNFYDRAVELAPDNETYAYFAAESDRRAE